MPTAWLPRRVGVPTRADVGAGRGGAWGPCRWLGICLGPFPRAPQPGGGVMREIGLRKPPNRHPSTRPLSGLLQQELPLWLSFHFDIQ